MKVALCNKIIKENMVENRKNKIKKFFIEASQKNADIIIMPESYLTGYASKKENVKFLSKEDSLFIELIDLSNKLNLSFIIGFNEIENKNYYISAFVYDAYKQNTYIFKKTHLGFSERKLFKEGEEIPVFSISNSIAGINFCHEIHIPEILNYQSLKGALVSINISAAPFICGSREEVWSKILTARGWDSRINVLAVNYYDGSRYSLGAAATDYNGNYIYKDYENDGIHVFTINLYKTKDIKNNFKKYYPPKLRRNLIQGD